VAVRKLTALAMNSSPSCPSSPRHRWVAAASLLTLWALPVFGWEQGRLDSYVSEIDGSRQYYGVFVPPRKPPSPAGYPVVLHMHGYGWSVSARFSDWQREWATEHGWVIANVNGRGPQFYDAIGENDVINVLADLELKYGIDERRVFATGGSMGGTGAFRFGVRRPDQAAAVVGVDGWTDYKQYHFHWYARRDHRNAIEEFRRPLLEAISPLYVAGTAQTGAVGIITDLADPIVWPVNGIQLRNALLGYQAAGGGYIYAVRENPGLGHGRGYDIKAIYAYFLDKAKQLCPSSVRVQTTQLKYGQVHWARFERFIVPGLRADLAATVEGSKVTVKTTNLAAFSLLLPDSPVRKLDQVTIVVDKKPAYTGPPEVVTCYAQLDAFGRLKAWSNQGQLPAFRKTPELEGPIGDAFVKPFTVLYGTAGRAEAGRRNRQEAEIFARDWNNTNVHAAAVVAYAEDEVRQEDLQGRSVILFGTIETSELLAKAHSAAPLPVEVHEGEIVVHDGRAPSRRYEGEQFGAFFVYPNPLQHWQTYLLVSHGLFATYADARRLQNLGYDLEKLPWAWPDYVVFNMDRKQLPYVWNVNNKAHTMCYEAGYFVEAGFFDQDWQPDRTLELRRTKTAGAEHGAWIHVADLSVTVEGPECAPRGAAKVLVKDNANHPVPRARVTLGWSGAVTGAVSAVTDERGVAVLRSAPANGPPAHFVAHLINVMATGATYDFSADVVSEAAADVGPSQDLALRLISSPESVAPGDTAQLSVEIVNLGTAQATAELVASADSGLVVPARQSLRLPERDRVRLQLAWLPGETPLGPYRLCFEVTGRRGDASPENNVLNLVIPVNTGPLGELRAPPTLESNEH